MTYEKRKKKLKSKKGFRTIVRMHVRSFSFIPLTILYIGSSAYTELIVLLLDKIDIFIVYVL
jgi:hypothetical protein